MSALWITGYLAIVIFGASIAIITFLRVELWLQGRRIRSRGRQRRVRLSLGAGSEAASAMPEDPDVQSSGVTGPARSPAASFPTSALAAGQTPAFHGNNLDEGKTVTVGRAPSNKHAPVPNGNGKDATRSKLGTTSARQSAVSRAPSPFGTEAEAKNGLSSQANSGVGKKESSLAHETRYAVPGGSLDDLYDREVATVICSELVDENEREQEWGVDDMIEAEVI